jgi:hypothetical protein
VDDLLQSLLNVDLKLLLNECGDPYLFEFLSWLHCLTFRVRLLFLEYSRRSLFRALPFLIFILTLLHRSINYKLNFAHKISRLLLQRRRH